MNKQIYVYILTDKNNKIIYTGVTDNLKQRVKEHKEGTGSPFTKMYQINKLVYYEFASTMNGASSRKKQIRIWSKQKKIELIDSLNPVRNDLFDEI